jgi:hypothetical protein
MGPLALQCSAREEEQEPGFCMPGVGRPEFPQTIENPTGIVSRSNW